MHARPAITRHNESLKVIDLAAVTSLIAAFFLLANLRKGLPLALAIGAGLLILDGLLRYAFMQLEVRRLCASSSKWNYRGALRHVRRRAKSPMFN